MYHDGVEGDVLKCQRLVSAALNIDLLGGRLLDGEAGGGFQLRHPVPAVPQALQHDLAAGVSEVDPQVVELAGVGAIAAVPELEFGPLDGAAGDAVYLLDGKGGLFVVLEIDGVVPVGIEGDQLGLHAVAVRRLHQEYGVRHRLPGVRVPLHHRQIGPDIVLQDDGGGLAGEELHMAFHRVDDVV